jgi:hypothetical protein
MRHRSTLLVVLLIGGLPGCGASSPRADVGAAELEARSARAEAMREHAELIELKARLSELEHRLARTRACHATPDPRSVGDASASNQPRTQPLRSEGDFLAEARTAAPAAKATATTVALGAPPQAATAPSERERLELLLQELRAYGFDPQSGLSPERREALRVLLRRERQLDLMNPWDGQ